MYCDIKDTKYGKKLASQIGSRQAKEFAMAIEKPKFQSWFGNGKTITLENGQVVPFINPVMQVINEKGNSFNMLERFHLKSMEDVKNFLSSGVTGITSLKGDVYSISNNEDRYIGEKLFKEIERIYPSLLIKNGDTFTINSNYNFTSPKVVFSKTEEPSNQSEIKEGVDFVFEQNPELASIGSQEQYSQYLNTIFPDSKVRDIVYHGSNKTFDNFNSNNDTYFSSNIDIAKGYQEKFDIEKDPSLKHVLLNIRNPHTVNGNNSEWFKIFPDNSKESRSIGNIVKDGKENNNDGVIINNVKDGLKSTGIVSNINVVFKPEQIHILGSKQDVEEFKKWRRNNPSSGIGVHFSKADNAVNYNLKSLVILDSQAAVKFFEKANKFKIRGEQFWEKMQKDLSIPKNQINILRSLNTKDPYNREELLIDLFSNYSFAVEINIAKSSMNSGVWEIEEGSAGGYYVKNRYGDGERSQIFKTFKEAVDWKNSLDLEKSTQHYSNLTVPGGTNYTENEIATPAITPSIKGHAQFATDNGIGWFRSDEMVIGGKTQSKLKNNDFDNTGSDPEDYTRDTVGGTLTKARRILEVQSDLFQKGRDKEDLINEPSITFSNGFKEERVGKGTLEANQFLQLLNKDNNWVTFFIKSIVQDSQRKGYEKVLFPSGNTASKVEGHSTLEEFKKQKEDRLIELKYKKEEVLDKFNGSSKIEWQGKSKIEWLTSIETEELQLQEELKRVETEGFGALKPIYNFYENTVTNILKKQGFNPVLITDEYGNTWNEVEIKAEHKNKILLQKTPKEQDNIIEEALSHTEGLKGVYKELVNDDPRQVMFEAAYQAISSPIERKEAERIFGKKFISLSLELYPNMQKSDTYASYVKPVTTREYDTPQYNVSILLKKLSMRFNIPYRTVDIPGSNRKGWYDVDGTVVINLANVTSDTPFHEFLHPFMLVLEKQNPALYSALAKELPTTKEGIEAIENVNRLYPELNVKEATHEAIVQHIGKIAGKRFEEQPSAIKRFFNWLKSIFKKINIRMENLSGNTTLSDIADMMVDDRFVVSLANAQSQSAVIVRESRIDTETTYETVFERIKDRIAILSATIKNRRNGDKFKQDIADLTEMLKSEDEVTSINNFVSNALTYVKAMSTRFEALRKDLNNVSTMSKDDIRQNMTTLGEIQQLLNVYQSLDSVVDLLFREGKDTDKKLMDDMAEAIKIKNVMISDFKSFALTYLTEWLYPFLEPTNRTLEHQGYKNKVLKKEDFREQLKMALSDISAPGFWLGTVINSKDSVSAAVGLALKNLTYENHLDNLQTKSILKDSYSKARLSPLFTTKKDEDEFNLQFLREAEVWEKTGVDEEGKDVFGYVKRLAFHTEFLDDQFKKDEKELYKRVGDRPSREDAVAYKKWSSEVSKFYSENTRVNPRLHNIIDEKRKTLSRHQLEEWFLQNTKEIEEEYYAGGMKKSDFYGIKVHSHDLKRGTFRAFTGELIIPSEKYRNKEFGFLMKNDYYRELYSAYKKANDKLGTFSLRFGIIPQVSKGKNLFSDLSWSKSAKENLRTAKENIKQKIDGEFDRDHIIERQDGSEVRKVPIDYLRKIDVSDLSINLLESVMKFSQVANNYVSMNEIEPNIILLKTILNGDVNLKIKGREVASTSSKGATIINKITERVVPKAAKKDLLNKRLNEFIDDVVYGDDEFKESINIPIIGEISLNKLGSGVGFLTSLQNMAINLTGGINNVAIGNFNNSIEAVGGRFWGKRDWVWAHKEYWSNLHEFVGEVSGVTKSDINAFADHYDVPQGEFKDQFGNNLSGGKVNQLFKTSTLFFIQSAGEHEIQITGLLSLMRATKLKNNKGEDINLYQAWKAAEGNFETLVKDNKWTKEDDVAFRNRLHAITKNLQGIYNKFDKATLQRRWYGKMALMFRKYMFSSFKARYGGEYVDYELGTVQQGYWNAFTRKLLAEAKEYKWAMIQRMWTKEGYNENEKAAMNKTVYELGVILAFFVMAGLVGTAGDDDDDAKWLKDEASLQVVRFSADITQFLSPIDFLRVIRNPAASVNMIEKWIGWFAQLASPTEVYERRSGIAQKGDNKLFIKTLKVVPVVRQVVNFMTPEEQIKFYNLTGVK